uniref:Uncharacterized protein n=1 Tax=Helianthus annuus TaxID=4232 RepID=A0A251UAL1_HELAN
MLNAGTSRSKVNSMKYLSREIIAAQKLNCTFTRQLQKLYHFEKRLTVSLPRPAPPEAKLTPLNIPLVKLEPSSTSERYGSGLRS